MRGLSFIEFMALIFTGLAGIASAVQAYVSYETRGEVARAIVFAERIDACAAAMSAIEPFRQRARAAARARVAAGSASGRYSLPGLYYRSSSGNPGFEAKHGPRVKEWRDAYAQFTIVLPADLHERARYFDRMITEEIPAGAFMNREEMVAWLERFDGEAAALAEACRALVV